MRLSAHVRNDTRSTIRNADADDFSLEALLGQLSVLTFGLRDPLHRLTNHRAELPNENGRIDIVYDLRDFRKPLGYVGHLLKCRELCQLREILRIVLRIKRILIAHLRYEQLQERILAESAVVLLSGLCLVLGRLIVGDLLDVAADIDGIQWVCSCLFFSSSHGQTR